jgi:hypothetical protein
MKNLIVLSIFFISFINTKAQSKWTFPNGFGLLLAPVQTKYINEVTTFNDTSVFKYDITAYGFSYYFYPKYHFVESATTNRKSSSNRRSKSSSDAKSYDFSAGVPIMFGFGGNSAGVAITYNLALTADINFGNCAVDNDAAIGAFVGLGFGVANSSTTIVNNSQQVDNSNFSSKNKTVQNITNYRLKALGYGPVIHGGVQFGEQENSRFGINVAYQPAINSGGLNYYTFGLQFPMNRFNAFF